MILEKDIFDGETYNVLTKNFTVEDIIMSIKKFVPGLEVAYVESAIMNQLSYDVDDKKFRSKGFMPQGDLEKATGETIGKFSAFRS